MFVVSSNIDADFQKALRKGFMPIGYSSFNGRYEAPKNAIKVAKLLGATLVLVAEPIFESSRTVNSTLYVPTKETTTYSGSVTTNSFNTYNYTGTATTSTTKAIPYSYTIKRYDHLAYFFISFDVLSLPIGIWGNDLTREERIDIGSPGVKVGVIYDDTPAYNSDLLVGDVITELNGVPVKNSQDFHRLSPACHDNGYCTATVIRNGETKRIRIYR